MFCDKNSGYGYAYGFGIKVINAGSREKYGKICVTGDIIDMYCDLNNLQLRFSVNGIDQGISHKIEKTKYKAAVNLFIKDDSIQLLC